MRLVIASLTLGSTLVLAQPVRNAVERAKDRQDLRQDKRQLADDRWDRARATRLLGDHDVASAKNDAAALGTIDTQFQAYVAMEIQESQREAAQKQQEVREDKAEVRGDRRELARDRATGKGPLVKADDRRDLARDKANLADDRADAARERLALDRLQAIQRDLAMLSGKQDPASVTAKRALYAELVGQARAEVQGDKVERREDKRELREDRRERREDRRQR